MKQRAAKRPADERKREILESAQAVFAAEGYANAGAEDVARAAGVAPSAIYRHFPSKRDLYLAALRDAGPRLQAIWNGTAATSGDPLEAAWKVGLDYYDHVQTRAPYASLWFQALGDVSDPEVREVIAGNYTGIVGLLERQLATGQAAGVVRDDIDARIAAWHFMAIGLTFDLVHHLGLDDELNREKVEAWGRLYLDSIRAKEVSG
ncbi:MAG: TetR/AcrR family transcriptional regulator [Chloroflexi bacterium]|nr:TetR/AcrR family transcriptional regulator [Chloroflexota bacterium]